VAFSPPGLRLRVGDPYDWGPTMSDRQQRLRLTAALLASAALHAVVVALLLRSPPIAALLTGAVETPEAKLIPVSLVSRAGGGGGGPLAGLPSPPAGHDDRPPVPEVPPAAKPSPPPPLPAAVERKVPPVATPSSSAVASLRSLAPRPRPLAPAPPAPPAPPVASGGAPAPSAAPGDRVGSLGAGSGSDGGGGGRGGAGTGDGSGGDGSDGLARPAYGSNPKPPYPLAARRLGVEGVVLLDVLVRPDGSPAEVRVRTSSGSALLDDSAVETVRSHWRFIPARRGNVPVESRVSFPIRFKLDAG
jgi:protein TonB